MASLREEKYAQTKIDILNAFLEELKAKPLSEISVKEVCQKTRISMGTFFNYYKNKTDVVSYYVQIWSIKVGYCLSLKTDRNIRGLAGLYTIFNMAAAAIQENPAVMREITAEMALSNKEHAFGEMVSEEYRLLFPGMTGVEEIKGADIVSLMFGCLQDAGEDGLLSKNVDMNGLIVDLLTIFFATHVTLWQMNLPMSDISEHYKRQLDAILNKALTE